MDVVPTSINPERGLSTEQVAQRVAGGLTNEVPDAPTRSLTDILRANILTRFNALVGTLLAIVLALGAFKDALFGGVIIANSVIGIIQELRAKRTLDRLALLSAPKATLVRDGEVSEHPISGIVQDDVLVLVAGNQIVADSKVVVTDNLEVDESLLTGESDPIIKNVGDELLSGSFVIAGSGRAQVFRVGADAYATKLAQEAKKFTLARSELRHAIDQIVTWVSWALIPVGCVLFWSQWRSVHSWRDAAISTVGGVVAMIPEGLVLLTSVAFAVGVVRLARQRTLVQELPAIDVLARVDMLCLDKTGTITTGAMSVADILYANVDQRQEATAALWAVVTADPNPNATSTAVQQYLGEGDIDEWQRETVVPFSSARKWSAVQFIEKATFIFGAPEMIFGAGLGQWASVVEDHAQRGQRVVALASSPHPLVGELLPEDIEMVALVLIEDTVRDDAEETLRYFTEQGVTLKVISGDNPVTVGAVAKRVGLPSSDKLLDARSLPEDEEELATVLEENAVFGRVSPFQKRAMVNALKSRGHVVAMTGDGVNDVLALKDADVGIAMASGSEATRAVAQLVLLDSSFAGLPRVVNEGRRVINNLQRVASLFLTKTVYAICFAIATGLSGMPYPFLPRHLTVVGTVTIGVPAFFLALAPNTDRVRGNFLRHVGVIALPGGVAAFLGSFSAYIFMRTQNIPLVQERTSAAIVLVGTSLAVLVVTSRPFVLWKGLVVGAAGAIVAAAIVVPPVQRFLEFDPPRTELMAILWVWVAVSVIGFLVLYRFVGKRFSNEEP